MMKILTKFDVFAQRNMTPISEGRLKFQKILFKFGPYELMKLCPYTNDYKIYLHLKNSLLCVCTA